MEGDPQSTHPRLQQLPTQQVLDDEIIHCPARVLIDTNVVYRIPNGFVLAQSGDPLPFQASWISQQPNIRGNGNSDVCDDHDFADDSNDVQDGEPGTSGRNVLIEPHHSPTPPSIFREDPTSNESVAAAAVLPLDLNDEVPEFSADHNHDNGHDDTVLDGIVNGSYYLQTTTNYARESMIELQVTDGYLSGSISFTGYNNGPNEVWCTEAYFGYALNRVINDHEEEISHYVTGSVSFPYYIYRDTFAWWMEGSHMKFQAQFMYY